MMGLALGVDYALLMVSRFREELANGAEPFEAAATTRRTAGRTTVFAGSTLFLAMVVAIPILPGALLVSLAGHADGRRHHQRHASRRSSPRPCSRCSATT